MALRLAFLGTSGFAVPALRALAAAGHDVAAVYTRRARAAGRGLAIRKTPVASAAEDLGLDIRTPDTLRGADTLSGFADLRPDAAVTAAYGLLLPSAMLAVPRLGCLNIHASLLPRWRGAAPIQHAILAGDAQTGVTIMVMDRGLDTGPVLNSRSLPISGGATAGTLHAALASIGAALVVEALAGLDEGRLRPVAQPAEGATCAGKITRAETRLNWRADAALLERQVRAFAPAPGAWFEIATGSGVRVRVLRAQVAAPPPHTAGADAPAPGCVLDTALTVACGGGALRLLEVQRQGRARTSAAAFLRGFPVPPGTRLPAPP